MGFDNECILNIQSLPGEYFCPVCRTLIYPNEALQSQCTHLYCKPCLAYVVATTRACPYDGYLVTETDSKPLVESNKSLAETIGKVAVRCLYYRSGCQWQGGLSECVTHCAECTFGNSAVICNRCGTQILHRQVQEHGQTCPGMQPQGQQAESQAQDSKTQVQAVAPDQSSAAPAASASAAPTAASAAAPTAVTAAPAAPLATAAGGQGQIQSNAVPYQQAAVQAQTPDQWYQQQQLQYQQYYQQYPGYDPYQQQYQQYAQYQQQAHPQYAQQQMPVVQQQVIQGQQQQPQYVMPQPQVQVHPQHQPPVQPQPHLQPQVQPQPQAMPQSHPPTHPQAQPQLRPQTQPYPQLQPHLQQPPQLQPQAQPQLHTQPVSHPQPHAQVTQPHLQQQYPPQSQPQPQIQAPVQQLHASAPQPHPHAQSLPLPPPHAQPGGQLLQPQPRPNHPQPQPHHLLQPSQIQATPQHLQSLPPQQHPHAQMQHPQSHPQQQPPPHSHPLPQHQQPHAQSQAQPMPQPHPFPQPQPQHPSAQAVSGHQSYPQPQPVQQYPMQVPAQQHNPQHPMQAQNQFPHPQTSQMRPPHSQLPVQVQQQPNMIPPQGPHASIGSTQSQAHHLVQQGQQIQQGQQMHQYPGMQPRAQPQGAHVQPHPGQSQQMHPQQQLHAQGHQYMQQQGPVQPQLQQSVAPAMSHEAQVLPGRSLMPNQGMQQPPYQQSPASNKPLLASVNQQSPNKSYPARATVQHDQLARPESQVSASAALQSGSQPNPLVSEQSKQSADLKTSKSEVDFKSENREATAADVTEEMKSRKDSKVDEDGPETHLNEKDTKEQELKPPVQEDARESSDVGKESSDKGLQNSVEPSSSTGTVQPENINSQGQTNENITKNIHAPSQNISQQQNNIHDLHRPSTGQGSYPVQPSSFGQSPKMRPPAPERMFPEHVPQPGPNQDRKLPGPPPQMQVFGQAPPPAQMGPPLRNIPETFPYQSQPSMAPHGSYPSQVPHPSLAGPDVPPSSTMPPGPFGHQQNYMPPPHAFGATNFQGQQPLGRPGIGAPPSGPGGSAFGMENQMGPSHPAKSLEAERYGVEKAGFSGWQHEPRPAALGPFGQPHAVHPGPMSTNGLPKERYGPVPEENFRPFPEQPKVYREERIVPSTLDLKRFEEDMKRFPRPDHLDREGRPPYDGHMSSTRPFDIPQPFGGPFPPSSGGLAANPTDYGDRLRPLGHHEDLGRRHDPLRSSGGEYTGSWQGKFGSGNQSHMNDFTSRDPHGFDERSKTLSLGRPYGPGSIRKDIDGTEVLPSRLGHVEPNGFGGIHNLRMGDPLGPGNLSTSRHGYPGETKPFNSFPIPGGMDSIEYSRMRKPGSMGLCRICKIDCETVEGLDLHSQTREHQKMAMHMVLSIKQENAKRQKLNYEGNVPFEDANKVRKPSFESHMNWA